MAVAAAPYHHPDLRAALLAAALGIVETQGAAALSLRGVARRAGVSAMAPYHHFKDRAALVAAVAEAGFERLYAGKLAALAAAGDDPRNALVAGSRAYVGFIIANPELYRLMKGPELADRAAHPGLARAAAAPAAKLAELLGALAGTGGLGTTGPASAAQMLWAFAHGLGLLAIDGYIAADAAPGMAATGAEALLDGLAAAPSPHRHPGLDPGPIARAGKQAMGPGSSPG